MSNSSNSFIQGLLAVGLTLVVAFGVKTCVFPDHSQVDPTPQPITPTSTTSVPVVETSTPTVLPTAQVTVIVPPTATSEAKK